MSNTEQTIASQQLPRRSLPRPSTMALSLLLGWAGLGVVVAFAWLPMLLWWAVAVLLAMVLLIDAVRLYRIPSPGVRRQLPQTLAIGIERTIALELDPGNQHMHVQVHDLHPNHWQTRYMPQILSLQAGNYSTLRYQACPTQRGDALFAGTQILLASPWRLWWQSRMLGGVEQVRVFPNFAPLTRFALSSAERTMRMLGAHLARKRGDGTDFDQLREYRTGDQMRQIDWKATARHQRLISRQYRTEQHQQIVLVLDTGRRMLARDDENSHFDHALDATLVLGYLAMRQGDAVGLFASGGQQRWVAPQRGLHALDALLQASYDLQPRAVATDYLAAANQLSLYQQRRSLLLWVTNVRDESIDELLAAVKMLQKRHIVIVASLREQALDQALNADIHSLRDAIDAGAIAHYLEQRRSVHERLRQHNVSVLDVTCQQLAGALVQEYLSIKRRGAL